MIEKIASGICDAGCAMLDGASFRQVSDFFEALQDARDIRFVLLVVVRYLHDAASRGEAECRGRCCRDNVDGRQVESLASKDLGSVVFLLVVVADAIFGLLSGLLLLFFDLGRNLFLLLLVAAHLADHLEELRLALAPALLFDLLLSDTGKPFQRLVESS